MEAILVLRSYINSPSELLRHRALKSEKKCNFGKFYFFCRTMQVLGKFFLKCFQIGLEWPPQRYLRNFKKKNPKYWNLLNLLHYFSDFRAFCVRLLALALVSTMNSQPQTTLLNIISVWIVSFLFWPNNDSNNDDENHFQEINNCKKKFYK